jgi:hypothetical protein
MGLYNMVFGTSRQAPLVLALLEQVPGDFGRFRDAWIEKAPDGVLRLVVYTRCGGGNRDEYAGTWGEIRQHPLYVMDQDDDFDCTYASAFFRFPDELPASLVAELPEELKAPGAFAAKVREAAQEPVNMGERWQAAVEALGKSKP